MARSRQRLANFEARSVQLIAACTLGLAGVASMPNATLSRITGQASSTHSPNASHANGAEAPRQLARKPGA